MSTTIGNVELGFISSIDSAREVPFSEVKDIHGTSPKVITHQPDTEIVTIEFVLSQKTHSGGLTVEEQRNNITDLADSHPSDNRIQYREYDGWFAVTDYEFGKSTGQPIIQEGVLTALYLPYDEYSSIFES